MKNTCNILFTSAGRRVALIRHFFRAHRELHLDGKILSVDASDQSPAFHIADASYLVPRVDTAGYIPRLLDIWYVENWSLWLDVKILLKTVTVVIRKEGLYGEGGVNDDFLSSKKNNPPSVKSV